MSKETEKKEGVVTEDELRKTLEQLEGKKPEETPKEEKVEQVKVEKTTMQALQGTKSEPLKKALEVSDAFKAMAQEIATHVDSSILTLEKSVNEAAQRDLSFVRVLEKMSESIESLRETMEKYGDKPASSTKSITSTKEQVIEKTGDKNAAEGKASPEAMKKSVIFALEQLSKSHTPGSGESTRFALAAAKFETSGEISDQDLLEVKQHLGKMKAA